MRSLLVLALFASPVWADETNYKKSQAEGRSPMREYKRAAAGAVPTYSEARVAKFLAASLWEPGPPAQRAAPRLRFIAAGKPAPKAKKGESIITIGRLAKRDGKTLVEIDRSAYVLAPCRDRKTFACLSPTNAPFDPPDESDQERQKREEMEQLVRQQRALKK